MVEQNLEPYIERLRELPYVREVSLTHRTANEDARIEIRTPVRKFALTIEVKRAYLDRTLTNALVALAARRSAVPLLVLARYVSQPSGERLAAAGINFVDLAGNVHLRLGDKYHTFWLGKHEKREKAEGKRPGPAAFQVLFTFLARPEAIQWPARQVAGVSGAGKTAAAEARRRLISNGILQPLSGGRHSPANAKALQEDFIRGYGQVLRPHISLGRFRSAGQDPEEFVERLAAVATRNDLKWALTGGPGAYELDRFYRGEETPVFIGARTITEQLKRELKLLPDTRGPITCLHLFGDAVLWTGPTRRPIAHPWLIYAELLYQGEPRSLEAAEEIRKNHLEK